MKKKIMNNTHIEGLLYDCKLEKKVTGEKSKNPGTEYITGTIDVATDNACENIIQVHFGYVAPTFPSKGGGNPRVNPNYGILTNFMSGVTKKVMSDGAEEAAMISVDSSIGVNEFYVDRDGSEKYEELVSAKRNEGGFIHVINHLVEDENARNTFQCDMLITNTKEIEPKEDDPNGEVKVNVKGYVFDYNKAIYPVDFTVLNKNAQRYFLNLEATAKAPVFTNVTGRQISRTIIKRTVEEGAWGEDIVTETPTSRKEFVITNAHKEPYIWNDEDSGMTDQELIQAQADRDTYLAALRQNAISYHESKKNPNATMTVNSNTFNF